MVEALKVQRGRCSSERSGALGSSMGTLLPGSLRSGSGVGLGVPSSRGSGSLLCMSSSVSAQGLYQLVFAHCRATAYVALAGLLYQLSSCEFAQGAAA